MWRTIVILFLASACALYGEQPERKEDAKRQSAQAGQEAPAQGTSNVPSSPPATAETINRQTSPGPENRHEEHFQTYFSRLFAAENLPNIILALVGIAGIVVAICTLHTIRKQTDATEIAANAARDSADIMRLQAAGRI